jgi:hypothetical protein
MEIEMAKAMVEVITTDRTCLFLGPKRKVFEFDPDEFFYPEGLEDYIAEALCSHKSISVVFMTEETDRQAALGNRIIAAVSGYSAVACDDSQLARTVQ